MVHRALPKVSKYCQAKTALTLHYQPRFRRNQSMSTHNSAALRATPRYCRTPQILWAILGTCLRSVPGPLIKSRICPFGGGRRLTHFTRALLLCLVVRTPSAAQPADLHFYLIDFDLPSLPVQGRRRLIILGLPALSCPCLALPCIDLCALPCSPLLASWPIGKELGHQTGWVPGKVVGPPMHFEHWRSHHPPTRLLALALAPALASAVAGNLSCRRTANLTSHTHSLFPLPNRSQSRRRPVKLEPAATTFPRP